MVSEYEFWLVDLDGTLVDVDWGYTREVFDRVGDRIGRPFTDREAEILWNGYTGSRDRQLEVWGIEPTTFWDAFHAEEDPMVRAAQTFLHDDAAIVGDLDVPVGLLTHCQRFLTDPVLDHLDIRDWFDAVLCCSEETGWKPDPAPVRRVMADLGVDPRIRRDGGARRAGARPTESRPDGPRSAYAAGATAPASGTGADRAPGVLAGDGSNDVGAAWNAGLDAIHVERIGHERRGQCVLGDYRVTSFEELP